ncbi:ThiF family adenylyltransferase [Planctomycetales bacterium ZRK34]|nr:ThiF family adenylyltransferase [Planctomycetales bacterium ZRK34]
MRYSLTILEEQYSALTEAVFSKPGFEGAAYLLCGASETTDEVRLLVRDVIPVEDAHYLDRTPIRLSIMSDSYVRVAKRARDNRESIIFVHSHPVDHPGFSDQDDSEDPKLMDFFSSRAQSSFHGSMVFNTAESHSARIRIGSEWKMVERTRIIGRRFRFKDTDSMGHSVIPEFFDRQVRAFGPEIQMLLAQLHIGVVGAGGVGSSVIQQLARLGVGTLSIFDGDQFESTNVNRVYGSDVFDEGRNKVQIQTEEIHSLGLGTEVRSFPNHITEEAVAKELRSCDIVFGCADLAFPRSVLTRLSLRYYIPCIDTGVKIQSEDGTIRGIYGRITTLLPGEACLFCRGRITPQMIREESLPSDQREAEIEEGYANELETDEPAVVMFTTSVASQAICELLHRLTGFMGENRQSSELLLLFHESQRRTNRLAADPECQCSLKANWGRGDTREFLGLNWPSSNH